MSSPQPAGLTWQFARAGLLVLVVLAAFYPVFGHEFLEWDDQLAIYENRDFLPPTLASLGHYWTEPYLQFYVPVTYTIWWTLAHVAGAPGPNGAYVLSPVPYHAANFVAHVGSAIFLYLILARLVRNPWAAWIGAAFFALHPLQVEPVSWTSTMYSALSGCFALVAAWAYLNFSDRWFEPPAKGGKSDRRAWAWFAAFVAMYAVALLTKPTIILLPVILGVIELWLRERPWRQLFALLLPVLVVGAVPIAIMTESAQPAVGVKSPAVLRPLVAGDAMAFYLRNIVVPWKLGPDYGRSPRWLRDEAGNVMYLTWIVPAALFAAAALAWRRTRWPAVACAIFILGLLPMLGLRPFDYQRYSTVADRYAYVALIAPAMLVAVTLARWWGRPAIVCAAAVLVLLGAISNWQTRKWRDTDTFYDFAMQRNPQSLAAHTRVIRVLTRQGRQDEALEHYRIAVRAVPDSPKLLYEMGVVCLRRGLWDDAISCFTQTAVFRPRESRVYSNLGIALAQKGLGADALRTLAFAIAMNPRDPDARLNAAIVLGSFGRYDEARTQYQEVIRLNGNVGAAKRGLAAIDAIQRQHGRR